MRVLFIGGTGNISAAVSRRAIEQGIELHILTRGRHPAELPEAHWIRADVEDRQRTAEVLQGQSWDAVVNWIAFEPSDIERDIEMFRDRTAQYIFISSAAVYQKPPSHPVITESTPLANPFWPYARNKIACEERLLAEYRQNGFPVTIVRPSLTYDTVIPVPIGGWDNYTIVDRMKRDEPVIVHGDGSSIWTITHAEDFARGFVGLLGHQQAVGHAFHITSDELLTWDQIYQSVAAAAGVEARIVHIASDFIIRVEPSLEGTLRGDKAHSVLFDNSKIKRFVPSFRATIPFKVGIRRTVEWFEASASRMRILPEKNAQIDRILSAYEGALIAEASRERNHKGGRGSRE